MNLLLIILEVKSVLAFFLAWNSEIRKVHVSTTEQKVGFVAILLQSKEQNTAILELFDISIYRIDIECEPNIDYK